MNTRTLSSAPAKSSMGPGAGTTQVPVNLREKK